MPKKATTEQIENYLEEKFTAMVMRPEIYGDLSGVEALALQVLEIWGLVQNPEDGSFAVRKLWEQNIAKFEKPLPIAFQVGHDQEEWRNYMVAFQQAVFDMFKRGENSEIAAKVPRSKLINFMRRHASEAKELEEDPEY